jgi:hypothetical protein
MRKTAREDGGHAVFPGESVTGSAFVRDRLGISPRVVVDARDRVAAPLLECVMHRGRLLTFEGKSWRPKEAAERLAKHSRVPRIHPTVRRRAGSYDTEALGDRAGVGLCGRGWPTYRRGSLPFSSYHRPRRLGRGAGIRRPDFGATRRVARAG